MASNPGCLVRRVFLVFFVTNLLVMAPQPAFDGLQPKSVDLQLTCLILQALFSPRFPCGVGHSDQYACQ